MSTELRDLLARQLDIAWMLTEYHLQTLSTEECLWRPAKAGLHIQQDADGRWRADWPEHEGYELGPSSLAWLTWHLGFWWSMVLDHCFGPGTLSREQVFWPGSADDVRASITALHRRWRGVLETMTDEALRSPERARWPIEGQPLYDTVAWVNIELAKNAAEIGYARFVFAARGR